MDALLRRLATDQPTEFTAILMGCTVEGRHLGAFSGIDPLSVLSTTSVAVDPSVELGGSVEAWAAVR